jgi:beta-1,4-mannosyltransferase
MLPRPGYTTDGSGRLTAASIRALQSLEQLHPDRDDLGILAYYKPVPRNPFQALLYSGCWTRGIAPVAVPSLDSLGDLEDVRRFAPNVTLHLHWTHPLTAAASDERSSRALADAFLERLDRHREAGGTFAWTVHNTAPHEVRHADAERHLRRGLVDRADLIHILSEATIDEARRAGFELPQEKVVHIRHPNYIGAYPTWSDRLATRSRLGLRPSAPVFGAVGAIRPYKQTEALLDAFDQLPQGPAGTRAQLLVAGAGAEEPLRDRVARHPAAIGVFEHLADATMVELIRACDVIVLPYRDVLNSGALILALSCARPVVAPAVGGLTEVADHPVITTFDPSDPPDLTRALTTALEIAGDPSVRRRALEAAESLDPDHLAGLFAGAIRRLWSGHPAPIDR